MSWKYQSAIFNVLLVKMPALLRKYIVLSSKLLIWNLYNGWAKPVLDLRCQSRSQWVGMAAARGHTGRGPGWSGRSYVTHGNIFHWKLMFGGLVGHVLFWKLNSICRFVITDSFTPRWGVKIKTGSMAFDWRYQMYRRWQVIHCTVLKTSWP